MEPCLENLMTFNSSSSLQTSEEELQNKINKCNNIENLQSANAEDTLDPINTLKTELSKSVTEDMNVDKIECSVNNVNSVVKDDFIESAKILANEINYNNENDIISKQSMLETALSKSLTENVSEIECPVQCNNTTASDFDLSKLSEKNSGIISDFDCTASCKNEEQLSLTDLKNGDTECSVQSDNTTTDFDQPENESDVNHSSSCRNEKPLPLKDFKTMDTECSVQSDNTATDFDLSKQSEKESDVNHSSSCGNEKLLSLTDIKYSENTKMVIEEYRSTEHEFWSEDDDSSSTSSSDSDFFQMIVESCSAPKKFPPAVKTKGELGLDDLPPIEDLVIDVHEEEMMLIGNIHGVVDKLVVIRALKDMKALDLDSVLFLSYNKPLGRIFDVFGPVVQPFYCVRFNSADHINEKGIDIGADVFFAPEKNDITSYVFVDELQKQKGSDASWQYNNEPPEEYLDFSDDEQEKAAKRKRMTKNRIRMFNDTSDVAAKRPSVDGDFPRSKFKPAVCSPSKSDDVQILSTSFHHNPFRTPSLPPLSPSPSLYSVMSAPVRVRNSFNYSTPRQPRAPYSFPRPLSSQNLAGSVPRMMPIGTRPPYVFGQLPPMSPVSPLLSPLFHSHMPPTIMPTPMSPENYFGPRFAGSPPPPNPQHNFSGNPQRFPRGPPVLINQQPPNNPWLHSSPNSPPVLINQQPTNNPWLHSSPNSPLPYDHPLTVQIPNLNHQPVQPFNNVNVYNRNNQSGFF